MTIRAATLPVGHFNLLLLDGISSGGALFAALQELKSNGGKSWQANSSGKK